jgi:5-methylcytosine-specific restriction endonuclease McrA
LLFPKAATPDRLVKPLKALSEDKIQVSFTADLEFEKDLLEARALLSHRFPKGKLGDVLGVALKALLKDLKKAKARPKKASSIPRGMEVKANPSVISQSRPPRSSLTQVPRPSRYIPRGMKAAIWERDHGCCSFKKPDGGVCGSTHFLEIDHRWPFALGGPHTEENLRLLCRTHNLLVAENFFGRKVSPSASSGGVPSG